MPKVSICIPTYKQLEYLRKTLDSILLQDYQDYEIVITDDSPDEGVKQLVETYDYKGKLKYYKNEKTFGSPENWNEAVRKASGEYIKMLHHDDFFTYSYSLSAYVEMLEKHTDIHFAFSASAVIIVDSNETWIHSATEQHLKSLKDDPRCLFFGNFIGAPSATIYRNNSTIKYDRNLKWVVDFDFYIQYLLAKKSFTFSQTPLITTIGGAFHNVSNECINNRDVEVFEYLHLFTKLFKRHFLIQRQYILFFRNLLLKYNIKSISQIRMTGFKGSIPLFIRLWLEYRTVKNSFIKGV